MAHTVRNKTDLLLRVRKLKGQVEACERFLEEEQECGKVLQTLSACRGAVNALIAEVIEGHVRSHLVDPDQVGDTRRGRAAKELIAVVRSYLR